MVLGSDGVRGEEVNDLGGGEAGVGEASKDGVDRVRRQRDQAVGGDLRVVGTTGQELQVRAANAVADTDGAGELNAEVSRMSI